MNNNQFYPDTGIIRDIQQKFIEYGLVEITALDHTIAVDLKYSTTDNFTHRNMYGELKKAYFVPEIASMLVKAQRTLEKRHPGLRLVIYDAARPMSIQS